MANILIIDDDVGMNKTLTALVKRMGHQVTAISTLTEGRETVSNTAFDVVLLDVCLPDGNGLNSLPEIRNSSSKPEVIIMTGTGDPDGAELALESGAWDYIEKPSSLQAITLPLQRALQYREGKRKNEIPIILNREAIVGNSPQIKKCLETLAQIAACDSNALISGETGTGKEVFANTIHQNSSVASKPFVVVDCASLPESLIESTLFGYEKGAFTGAERTSEGLIGMADGGTLFLDEVGELPFSLQKAFLRVLQEKRYRPIGAEKEKTSNFRLLAATNRNLDDMMQQGLFRSDLLFRLRTFNLLLPPLRERTGDIKLLSTHIISQICARQKKGTKGVSPEFIETIEAYDWPGNVRELFQTIEMVLASAQNDPILFPTHLPTRIRVKVARNMHKRDDQSPHQNSGLPHSLTNFPKLKEFRQESIATIEQQYLERLLTVTNGNIHDACSISGLSRARLYDLLKTYGLSKDI